MIKVSGLIHNRFAFLQDKAGILLFLSKIIFVSKQIPFQDE